ncbi:MAG: UDP-3-O-(3-hydroxymyristoyl)glucosamine N-acyltransferase [Acidobacteriota bacterium]
MILSDIAARIGGQLTGNGEWEINRISIPETAGPADIVFADKHSFLEAALRSRAGAFVVDANLTFDDPRPSIRTATPRVSFIKLLELFEPPRPARAGVHATVIRGQNCRISPTATIMVNCVLGDDVVVEDDAVIYPQCFLGNNTRIGAGTILHPQVVVASGCQIGRRCILFPGVVIGADGFGYHDEGARRMKIPHLGNVVLEDEVEVGANTTIDRAVLGSTVVAAGTKIDNLVQIGHNVQVGAKCYLVAQVGIGGSTKIGNGVVLGGQSGISDHLTIGDRVMVAGKSAVRESLPPGEIVGQPPSFPIRVTNELVRLLPQLPELFSRVSRLEEAGNAAPGSTAPSNGRPWSEIVIPVLARTLRVKPELIRPDMDLKEEFNADSLTVLTVVTEIESQFGIAIPDEDVPRLRTLSAIVNYLEKNYPDGRSLDES